MSALLLATALAAAASQPEVVATYRDGRVERRDLDSWRRALGHEGGTAPLRAEVEELVLMRVLASHLEGTTLAAECSRQQRLLALELAESVLRDHFGSGIQVAPAEVDAAVQADPASKPQPRRYALENILKRCSSGCPEEERQSLRRKLEDLEGRLLAGEDFAALAEQESDSETRARGGQMGYVALESLAPAVASAVKTLEPGQLAIVESRAGLTLLRLSRVQEPVAPDVDGLRRRHEVRLRTKKAEAAWEESSRALLATLQLDVHDPSPGDAPETVVASYRMPGDARPGEIALADLNLFLEKRRLPTLQDMTTPGERRDALVQRVLLDARHRQAEKQGLLTADYTERLEWRSLELRAQLAANSLADPVAEPSLDDLRQAYDGAKDRYRRPARRRLRALRLEIEASRPASLYEEMRLLGQSVHAGAVSFEAVAEKLRPLAQVQELGWLTETEVWQLGMNAEDALNGVPAGACTRAFQEGSRLVILHVAEREEERPLPFDEAATTVRAVLLADRRRAAGEALRRAILAEQNVRILE